MEIKPCLGLLTFSLLFVFCEQKTEEAHPSTHQPERHFGITAVGDTLPADMVISAEGKRIDPVGVTVMPKILSFKGETKVVDAHPNAEPAVVSEVVRWPKELEVSIPGEDGIRSPEPLAVRAEAVPILATPPTRASPLTFKESASCSIQNLGREQGLELENVYAILEDKRGHIWFGGLDGVSRYDGNTFTNFHIGTVKAMLEDSHGGLWFGVMSGLMLYDGHTFTVFNSEQGLNEIRAMWQDKRGKFWFGTPRGLIHYDPRAFHGQGSFTHYTTEEGLSANWVGAILEDKEGYLWIGTSEGLDRYDPEVHDGRGSFTHYPTEQGLGGKTVNAILQDSRGNLWVGSRKGLSRYDLDAFDGQGGYIHYPIKERPGDYLVFDLLEDGRGNIWVATDRGLSRFEPDETGKGGKFTHFTAQEGLGGKSVWSVVLDSQGNIWAGLMSGGVSRYNRAGFKFYTDNEGLIANTIRSHLEDSRGNIWWGALHGGITRYAAANDGTDFARFIQYPQKMGNLLFAIRSIKEDSRGNIWFRADHSQFRYNPANEGILRTYPRLDNVWAQMALEDRRGNVWFGARHSVWRYTPDEGGVDGRFSQFTLQGVSQRNLNIVEDKWGKVWLGAEQHLVRYDPDAGEGKDPYSYFTARESLGSDRILFMEKDLQGNIWIATDRGLSRINTGRDSGRIDLTHFTLKAHRERVGSTSSKGIQEDSQGNIWLVTDHGLSCFSPEANEGQGHFIHYSAERGYGDINLGKFLEDGRGNLWFGSKANGLHHYDPRAENGRDRFTHYSTKNGLTGNQIVAIIEDRKNNIWIITGNGVNLFVPIAGKAEGSEKDQYQIFAFDKSNGVKHIPSYNFSEGFLDGKDQLWWSSNQGLGMLDLKQFQRPGATAPRINLNTIEIKQNFIDYRNLPDSTYQSSLTFGQDLPERFDSVPPFYNYPQNLSLPHQLDHLTFQFSAIDWSAPQMLKYSYFLEGEDDNWSLLSPETKAEYRNLQPGKYTFKVKAIGSTQTWSKVFAYDFSILPPWWLSGWAYLLYGLTVVFLFYSAYDFLLARRLARTETTRRLELDKFKIRLYTNITHEFRTPLTIILGMAQQIKEDPTKWYSEGLQMITRNGRQLLNLVNQMLDLSKLDKGKLTLKMQQGEAVGFIQHLVQSFAFFAAAKNIQLHFLKETDQLEMDFDPDQLTKVGNNLLSNALKYTPEGGQVYIIVRSRSEDQAETSKQFELRVRDTGPGISAEDLPHIFDRFYQTDNSLTRKGEGTGIGLAFTKELVKLMGGTIQVQSKPGEGSDFSVVLPVTRSAPKAPSILLPNKLPHLDNNDSIGVTEIFSGRKAFTPKNEKAKGVIGKELPVALLIEDNHDVLTYLASCLEADYQLEFATNGQEGIEQALEIVPDIIISDVMMPEKDGYEVCAILKEDIRTSHIPIILLTAKVDRNAKLKGLSAGADVYLAKPFDKKELDIRLEKLLNLRRKLQARYSNLQFTTQAKTQRPTREELFLKKLCAIIEEHLSDENFSIVQLCRKIGLSRSQLHHKLKALTGQSASIYIRAIRLEKAKVLLQNTDLNISEVAYEVGFRTSMYFTQIFTEEVGVPPSVFRMNGGAT